MKTLSFTILLNLTVPTTSFHYRPTVSPNNQYMKTTHFPNLYNVLVIESKMRIMLTTCVYFLFVFMSIY